MLAVDERQQTEVDHVPRGAVLVAHQIQRHSDVRVTVVAAEVVLVEKKEIHVSEL